MKKMIIIEDNTERQNNLYLGKNTLIDSNILHNAIDNEYVNIYNKLLDEEFDFNYDVIAVHESAFEKDKSEIIEYLDDMCEELDIALIYFSGGISVTCYNSKPKVLYINEKVFYKNLELFLQNINQDNMNVQVLGYGENWEINMLNFANKKIGEILQNMEKDNIRFDDFKEETKLDMIINLIDEPELSNGFIQKLNIENLKTTVKKLLDKKMELL